MKRLQTPDRKDSSSGLTDSAFSEDGSSDSSEDSLQAEDSDEDSEESGAEMKNEEESMDEEDMSIKEESSEEEEDTAVNWKTNLAQKAADAFLDRQNSTANLWKLVYGKYIIVITLPGLFMLFALWNRYIRQGF